MNLFRDFSSVTSICLVTLSLYSPVHADDKHEMIGWKADHLPIFDAHVHYKRAAWEPFPPDVVLSMMDRNGVAMALVSSSPDEGTITLWKHAPNRIVPEMRPYNDRLGPSNWIKEPGMGDVIEQRVNQLNHQGIGEFHLHDIDPTDKPLLQRIVKLAMDREIPLHVHSDHEPVEYLYSLNSNLKIIWAHAGMTEPPEVIESMMERYPTLYADTSYREDDIMPKHGEVDEDWRLLLEQFSDRFMVGSDTWVNSQWLEYDELISTNRNWLYYLSVPAAHNIAYRNAENLFSRKISTDLIGIK